MRIRIEISPTEEHDESLFYLDIELPFVPPENMNIDLGMLPNGDIVSGTVIKHFHSLVTGLTSVCCEVRDDVIQTFAKHNGWTPIS